MSDKRKREFMEKLDSCYKVVQQSSAKRKGISAVEIAEQLGVHRTTVHSYLNSLEFMGKVYNEHGLWYAKDVKEDSIKEKEIELIIELPPEDEDEREYEARLKTLAQSYELNFIEDYLKARKDARTIKIRGKNIDAIKEELPKLIMETLKKQSKSKPFWKRKIKLS
jgi:predicted ArsR family transcriptional regulator